MKFEIAKRFMGDPRIVNVEFAKFEPWGMVVKIHMANGYTASIARHARSYGGREGLFEGAVQYGRDLVYDTPVTNDVKGWLSQTEAIEFCEAVAALPPREQKLLD